MIDLEWILAARDGGNVTRYHTRTLLKPQNNAEHSFNCAILALEICSVMERSYDIDTNKIVTHMLIHDIPEIGIGDVPHYVKKTQPEIKKALDDAEDQWCEEHMPMNLHDNMKMEGFKDVEIAIVKFIDQYEPLLKMREELLDGSMRARDLFTKMVETCYNCSDDYYELTKIVDNTIYTIEEESRQLHSIMGI